MSKGIGFVSNVKKIGNSLYCLIPNEVSQFFEIKQGDQIYIEIKIVKRKGEEPHEVQSENR